jgi:hypothetical protein
MKERPILFSAPMVRAILDGSKTQTRRAMKRQPHEDWFPAHYTELHAFDKDGELTPDKVVGWGAVNEDGDQGYVCPYGQPGDRLWVRETFALSVIDPDGGSPHDEPENYDVIYRADPEQPGGGWRDADGNEIAAPWKPSIHMPRWASRILLEIVSVRVERLQDISDQDAMTEGVDAAAYGKSHRYGYSRLWDEINGADSWDANPWVWVVEFKRVAP